MKNIKKYFLVSIFFITIHVFDVIILYKVITNNYVSRFSYIENRKYSEFKELKTFNLKKIFTSNNIQEDFEQSLSDIFVLSEMIRYFFKSELSIIKYDKLPKKLCKNNYIRVNNEYGVYNCDDRLVFTPYSKEKNYSQFQKNLKKYDSINRNVNTYYYYIPTSYLKDFTTNKNVINIEKEMKKTFKNPYTYSSLKVDNYSDYKNNFFKTDHHWNYKGSYQGYKDIIKMIYGDEEVKQPISEVEFKNSNFYGTLSTGSGVRSFKEPFSVYKFDLGKNDIKIFGSYGVVDPIIYKQSSLFTNPFLYHYYYYYGDDYSIVTYDFHNEDKENILIISNSFIKANRELIASHFNKTHVINLNSYIGDYGKTFNIKEYVTKNNITKVLFVCDYWLLSSDHFEIAWR